MGLAVLDRRRDFAEGLGELTRCGLFVGLGAGSGDEEQRVVAEAAVAVPLMGDPPVALAAGHEFPAVREDRRDGRHVVGGALLVGDIGEEAEELVVVRLIVAVRLAVPAPAGGVEAGRAVEGVDAEARVVRERRDPGEHAARPRLDERVLFKGGPGLFDIRVLQAQFSGGLDLDAERREDPGELGLLMFILRCDQKNHLIIPACLLYSCLSAVLCLQVGIVSNYLGFIPFLSEFQAISLRYFQQKLHCFPFRWRFLHLFVQFWRFRWKNVANPVLSSISARAFLEPDGDFSIYSRNVRDSDGITFR